MRRRARDVVSRDCGLVVLWVGRRLNLGPNDSNIISYTPNDLIVAFFVHITVAHFLSNPVRILQIPVDELPPVSDVCR